MNDLHPFGHDRLKFLFKRNFLRFLFDFQIGRCDPVIRRLRYLLLIRQLLHSLHTVFDSSRLRQVGSDTDRLLGRFPGHSRRILRVPYSLDRIICSPQYIIDPGRRFVDRLQYVICLGHSLMHRLFGIFQRLFHAV